MPITIFMTSELHGKRMSVQGNAANLVIITVPDKGANQRLNVLRSPTRPARRCPDNQNSITACPRRPLFMRTATSKRGQGSLPTC
jgi:hypothetical protein